MFTTIALLAGFCLILFWPLGLVVLGYLVGSGRMTCWAHGSGDRWQRRMERMQQRMERMQAAAEQWTGRGFRSSSGNRAFDEYRDETLRRLVPQSLLTFRQAVEAALASVSGDRKHLTSEAADVLYHLLVLLEAANVPLSG